LASRKSKILVVPCSSGAFGRSYPDTFDIPAKVGEFTKDTGCQVGDIRWINKNRVLYQMRGKASTDTLNKIDEYQLKLIPTNNKREAMLKKLLQDKITDEQKIRQLERDNEVKDEILESLTQWFINHEGV